MSDHIGFSYRVLRLIGHQRWMLRGRDRLIRLWAHPDRMKPLHFSVDFFGKTYEGRLDNFIDWSVFFFGCFARQELFILRSLPKAMRKQGRTTVSFYDVGANVGHHALFMSIFADNVMAFEPFPPVLEQLRRRIARNNLSNVQVFPFGLGLADEIREYQIPNVSNPGMGTFDTAQAENFSGQTIQLPLKRGDAFFEQEQLPRIDILKIDVEGFEKFVVDGLRERILRDRPIIMTELSERTRGFFGDEAAFHGSFYPNHTVFGVHAGLFPRDYRIAPLRYETDFEILIVPNELLSALDL